MGLGKKQGAACQGLRRLSLLSRRVCKFHLHAAGQASRASSDRHGREIVDLELEILHNRFGPLDAAGTDYLVMLCLKDVKVANIDVNAMLQDSWVMNMTLSRQADGLLVFDLEPNIGLDVQVTCVEVAVSGIRPYARVDS
jgi:hypothetical protein